MGASAFPAPAAALLILGGCATVAKPPPPAPATPTGAVAFAIPRHDAPHHAEVLFTPGENYADGIEVAYRLFDETGAAVHESRFGVGPVFDGAKITAGVEIVRRLAHAKPLIKVVGPALPPSALEPARLELARVRSAALIGVFLCRAEYYNWRAGMPLPPGVDEVPEEGTAFSRRICDQHRAHSDATLERSFRFRRLRDPAAAWFDVAATFGRDFEGGLTFKVRLLDAAGRPVAAGCELHIRQTPVFSGESLTYGLRFRGPRAVRQLSAVRRLVAYDVNEARMPLTAQGRPADTRLICKSGRNFAHTPVVPVTPANAPKPTTTIMP